MMNASVLLLNADAQPLSLLPLSTISWQQAIKTIFSDRALVIKNYDDLFLRSSRLTIPVPSIIMYHQYHKSPSKAKYNRKNLYIRDGYNCQYCGKHFAAHELTIDHVIPKCQGGKLTWENTVTACKSCNFHKGDKLIKPIKAPYMPSWHQLNQYSKRYKITIPDEAWQDFVQWPVEKLEISSQITLDC
jgi:5-methylcytosine-specific restriction endonuclease McrA